MMQFEECLEFTLKWEGGYVNHPNDPGGATNKGITQRTYDHWRVSETLPVRDVEKITDKEVYEIYLTEYWYPSKASSTFDGMDLCVFDSAVNMGLSRATKFLQEVMGVKQDGIHGPKTQLAVIDVTNTTMAIEFYCKVRENYYRKLAIGDMKFMDFIKGWLNRNEDLRRTAKENA